MIKNLSNLILKANDKVKFTYNLHVTRAYS